MGKIEIPAESDSGQPTDEEKELLDRELEDYRKNPNAGSSWKEVETRLRQSSQIC
jgi:putative addiction module component (TIGR02574 family)